MSPPDIFDRVMGTKFLKAWYAPYQKHKEKLLYLFFGGLTTVTSLVTFWFVNRVVMANEHIANVASWILAVLFAFLTNRAWVFNAKTNGKAAFFKQLFGFYGGRLLTFGIEELLLLIFITWLHFDSMLVKIAAQIVVLILNYVVSKLFVFRKQ